MKKKKGVKPKMTEILIRPDKDFKADTIKMLQQAVTNILQTNKNRK